MGSTPKIQCLSTSRSGISFHDGKELLKLTQEGDPYSAETLAKIIRGSIEFKAAPQSRNSASEQLKTVGQLVLQTPVSPKNKRALNIVRQAIESKNLLNFLEFQRFYYEHKFYDLSELIGEVRIGSADAFNNLANLIKSTNASGNFLKLFFIQLGEMAIERHDGKLNVEMIKDALKITDQKLSPVPKRPPIRMEEFTADKAVLNENDFEDQTHPSSPSFSITLSEEFLYREELDDAHEASPLKEIDSRDQKLPPPPPPIPDEKALQRLETFLLTEKQLKNARANPTDIPSPRRDDDIILTDRNFLKENGGTKLESFCSAQFKPTLTKADRLPSPRNLILGIHQLYKTHYLKVDNKVGDELFNRFVKSGDGAALGELISLVAAGAFASKAQSWIDELSFLDKEEPVISPTRKYPSLARIKVKVQMLLKKPIPAEEEFQQVSEQSEQEYHQKHFPIAALYLKMALYSTE